MRSPRGFTLIETLVSLFLATVLFGIVYGVFGRTLRSRDLAEARSFENAAVRGLVTRIGRELEGIPIRLPQPTARGAAKSKEGVEPPSLLFVGRSTGGSAASNEIAFTAFVRRPVTATSSTTDLTSVRYFAAADAEDSKVLGVYREAIPSLSTTPFDLEEPNPDFTVQLAGGLEAVEFRFHDGESWIDEWSTREAKQRKLLPLAVSVDLTPAAGYGTPQRYRTSVLIPLPFAAGAASEAQAPVVPTSDPTNPPPAG